MRFLCGAAAIRPARALHLRALPHRAPHSARELRWQRAGRPLDTRGRRIRSRHGPASHIRVRRTWKRLRTRSFPSAAAARSPHARCRPARRTQVGDHTAQHRHARSSCRHFSIGSPRAAEWSRRHGRTRHVHRIVDVFVGVDVRRRDGHRHDVRRGRSHPPMYPDSPLLPRVQP